MPTYNFLYVREQRVRFEIEAETEADALERAMQELQKKDLSAPDDESDDPGELFPEESP